MLLIPASSTSWGALRWDLTWCRRRSNFMIGCYPVGPVVMMSIDWDTQVAYVKTLDESWIGKPPPDSVLLALPDEHSCGGRAGSYIANTSRSGGAFLIILKSASL